MILSGVVYNLKLKVAKVIPTYKKQNAEIFSNYHLLSLLPYVFKSFWKKKNLVLTNVLIYK